MFKRALKGLLRSCGATVVKTTAYEGVEAHVRDLDGQIEDLLNRNRRVQAAADDWQRQNNGVRDQLRESREALARQESEQRMEREERRARETQLTNQFAREHDAYLSVQAQLAKLQEAVHGPSATPPRAETASATSSVREPSYDARHWTRLGEESQTKGDLDAAIAHYAQAVSLIHRYEPARDRMREISTVFFRQAEIFQGQGKLPEAKRALVRAIELHPHDSKARAMLAQILSYTREYDVTKDCLIYHDPERGKAVYKEAFLRAAEYVAGAGLLGEFLEFGVLGGFTARLQCEIMRDLLMWKQIHLFDSFEGLPPYESAVDRDSYDIGVRNIWENPMCFPQQFVDEQLGCPVDVYLMSRLSEVVSPDRIFVYRGFFNRTLPTLPKIKAALVHIDCDLYQSTCEVFAALHERDVLQDGCVILFDDYNCFRANPNFGERRAFREFLEGQNRWSCSPFYTYGWNGAAFILHDRTVVPEQV